MTSNETNAPSVAVASIYEAAAQALANAAHNATTSQQQFGVTLQAVATMGASLLLNSNNQPASDTDIASAPDASAEELTKKVHSAQEELNEAASNASFHKESDPAGELLSAAGDVSYAFRSIMDAVAASNEKLAEVSWMSAMDVIRAAAISACLNAMIRSPENTASFEQILTTIQQI